MIPGLGSLLGGVIGFPLGKRCGTTSVLRTAAKSRTAVPLELEAYSWGDAKGGPRQLRIADPHLFRGNCPSETHFVRERGTIFHSAKHPKRCKGLVRQCVSDLGGTTRASAANGERGGSAPPENGPRLHTRAFRGGRSRDSSLQEGSVAAVRRRGVRRRRPDRRQPLSGFAIQRRGSGLRRHLLWCRGTLLLFLDLYLAHSLSGQ